MEDVPVDRRPYVHQVRLDPARDTDFAAQIRDSQSGPFKNVVSAAAARKSDRPGRLRQYAQQVLGDGGI